VLLLTEYAAHSGIHNSIHSRPTGTAAATMVMLMLTMMTLIRRLKGLLMQPGQMHLPLSPCLLPTHTLSWTYVLDCNRGTNKPSNDDDDDDDDDASFP